jgi:hypothetical protein
MADSELVREVADLYVEELDATSAAVKIIRLVTANRAARLRAWADTFHEDYYEAQRQALRTAAEWLERP